MNQYNRRHPDRPDQLVTAGTALNITRQKASSSIISANKQYTRLYYFNNKHEIQAIPVETG